MSESFLHEQRKQELVSVSSTELFVVKFVMKSRLKLTLILPIWVYALKKL